MKKQKYALNLLIILALTGFALWFALKDNFHQVLKCISQMNLLSLVIVLLWGVLFLSILGILKEKSPKIDYYYKLIQSLIFIIMLVLSLTSYYFFEELEFISLGRSYLQCIVLKTRQATCVVPEIYFKHWLVDPHTKRYEGVYMVKKQNSFKEEMKIMKKCIEKDKGTVESINKKKDDDSYNVLLKQGEHYTLRIRKYKSFDIFEY